MSSQFEAQRCSHTLVFKNNNAHPIRFATEGRTCWKHVEFKYTSASVWLYSSRVVRRQRSVQDVTEKYLKRNAFGETLLSDAMRRTIDANAKNVCIKEICRWRTFTFQSASDDGWYAEGSFSRNECRIHLGAIQRWTHKFQRHHGTIASLRDFYNICEFVWHTEENSNMSLSGARLVVLIDSSRDLDEPSSRVHRLANDWWIDLFLCTSLVSCLLPWTASTTSKMSNAGKKRDVRMSITDSEPADLVIRKDDIVSPLLLPGMIFAACLPTLFLTSSPRLFFSCTLRVSSPEEEFKTSLSGRDKSVDPVGTLDPSFPKKTLILLWRSMSARDGRDGNMRSWIDYSLT